MISADQFANKQVLITGGLGFIGSNLARHLVKLRSRVTLVDSLIPEYGGNLFNISGIEDEVKINISDVRDPYSMRYIVKGQDYLFNLAGQTSHMDSMENPETDLDINCRAQLSILEACRRYNPQIKVVFASTRQVYGKPGYLPVNEDHPVRPTDVNGVNKMAGESYHLLYNQVYNLRTCVLRLTNTYGPRMRIIDARQTFLGIWLRLLIEGKSFEVWGGNQLRDFTFVDDAIEAFLLAAAAENSNGKIFNLGGEPAVSLLQLAEMLIQIHGKGGFRICHYPPERKPIDIGDYYGDFSKIKNELGWEPRVSLYEGLSRSINFYKENIGHYV